MNAQNQNQSPVMRRFYQMVAGTRKQPAGVCAGYFRSATDAREAYPRLSGYTRRVDVPDDLAIDVWGVSVRMRVDPPALQGVMAAAFAAAFAK